MKNLANHSAKLTCFDRSVDLVKLVNPDTLQEIDFSASLLQNISAREIIYDNKKILFQVHAGDSLGNNKTWLNANIEDFVIESTQEFEIAYGIFQFITEKTIIVDRLDGFEVASRERVLQIDDAVNEQGAQGGFDSYAYRSNLSKSTKLEFVNYWSLKRFEEYNSRFFTGKLLKRIK